MLCSLSLSNVLIVCSLATRSDCIPFFSLIFFSILIRLRIVVLRTKRGCSTYLCFAIVTL
jgi:hypothetical protein